MPIIPVPDKAECDACGAKTDTVTNDLPEDLEELDTGLPPGWVLVQGRMVTRNPRFEAEQAQRQQMLAEALSEIPPEAPPMIREQAEERLQMMLGPATETPTLVREIEGVLCAACNGLLQKRLTFEDWGEGEDDEE